MPRELLSTSREQDKSTIEPAAVTFAAASLSLWKTPRGDTARARFATHLCDSCAEKVGLHINLVVSSCLHMGETAMLVKNKFCSVLVVASMILSIQFVCHVDAQGNTGDEIRSIQTAIRDLEKDLRVAEQRQDEAGEPTMGKVMAVLLGGIAKSTSARLNNFEDIARLRYVVSATNDKRSLEAADAWINIRANIIQGDIDESLVWIGYAQKHAYDQRVEAVAIELRKQIRRVQKLWKPRKTSELFPEQPGRD